MTAKDFLSQAYRIDQRINSKLEQVQSLRDLATKATATFSDVPPSGTRNVHRMEDVICKMMDIEVEINGEISGLLDLKLEIKTSIQSVTDVEMQTILEMRYLCYEKWENIASALHLDLRWIYRLHDRALKQINITRH
ncbi:hypothetical protein FACS1894132_06670 [Clostridia bacterium]|nr:hypothetical protein FACS1894132_06670 [Clostridia bacterium]